MKRLVFLLAGFLSVTIAQAQQTPSIQALYRNHPDSVVLRWAPTNAVRWARLNRYGYKIERCIIDKDIKPKAKFSPLNTDSLKPWKVAQWKQRFPENHPYAPVAVQAVHGATFSTSSFQSEVAAIRAKSQEAELRHSFALLMADFDARVADGLALRYVDRNVPKDVRIQYRIIGLDPQFPDTVEIGLNRAELFEGIPVPMPPILEEGDRLIKLHWNTHPEAPVFTAFYLERSTDGSTWKRASSMPLIKADAPTAQYPEPFLYFTDTLVTENYKPVFYRLSGITPFGEYSQPSAVVVGMGRDRNAPPVPDMKNPSDVGGKLRISWDYGTPPADLKGFFVSRGPAIGGPFERATPDLLPVSARFWDDPAPDALGQNYYVVYAQDTAGNLAASLPAYGFLKDSIAPGMPLKPAGSIDTNGVVRLHWKLGPEPDILGYRVFFANAADHEFSLLTPEPHRDTTFTDTIPLNNLTPKIYYRVVAVDRNFNHSPISPMLMLRKPDKNPPVEPLFSKSNVTDTTVVLGMIASSSKDVAEHVLWKRKPGENAWKEAARWKIGKMPSVFTDRQVSGAEFYQYALQAYDSSGNASKMSPTADVRVKPQVSTDALTGLKASSDVQKKTITLAWNKPGPEVKYYVIYRGKNDRKPQSYTSVPANQLSWTESVSPGKYQYMIRAVYVDGGESPFAGFPVQEMK